MGTNHEGTAQCVGEAENSEGDVLHPYHRAVLSGVKIKNVSVKIENFAGE